MHRSNSGIILSCVVSLSLWEVTPIAVVSLQPVPTKHVALVSIRRCPVPGLIVFVPRPCLSDPRFDAYQRVSQQIREIFFSYTDLVEPLSLDEAYLDVTTNKAKMQSATWVAQNICKEIRQQTHLTASAGVSYNKFLAKIASDVKKPAGLTVVTPEQAESFIEQLPIRRFHRRWASDREENEGIGNTHRR